MGAAVVCSAYARVRTQNLYAQLCICSRHECLVKCTAGGEAAERMHPNLLAGSSQTCSNAHSVCLSDTSVDGLVREFLSQLCGVDAVIQVTVNVHNARISRHQLLHCGNVTVTAIAGVLLMLSN